MKIRFVIFTLVFVGVIYPYKIVNADLTPKEILQRADDARGNLKGVEWEIDLKSIEDGRKQNRTLNVKARDFNSIAEFLEPPKVKGRKLLMIDRNMWFIKPGLRKPVPISPRQKLMGGASNGDIASTNYAGDYEAKTVSEEDVDGEPCYLLDLVATNKRATYDRIRYWVSKERFVGVRSEFFTASGKLFKTATFEYNNRVKIDGNTQPFISKMVIKDAVIKENITTMIYRKVKIKNIPDSDFNLNLLVR